MMNPSLVQTQLSRRSSQEDACLWENSNEGIKENIMSLELAIRRELAYRRKMETLRLHSSSDCKQAPTTSQVRVQFLLHDACYPEKIEHEFCICTLHSFLFSFLYFIFNQFVLIDYSNFFSLVHISSNRLMDDVFNSCFLQTMKNMN
uniref:Uncharacterized protein n=1 Tax=Nelumbo nucifera TaxID=4432 RepID=A0A822YLC7_NELNU|nr:TPA_asm: hypothetical protein HUJ06_005614 [Nelumbo nucifera]